MEIQFSPKKNLNLVQRNINIPKKIKINSVRYLNSNEKNVITKFKRRNLN